MKKFLMNVILQAGRICLEDQNSRVPLEADFKSRKDLVTATDKKVEAFIIHQIKETYPTHAVHGEETGRSGGDSPYLWIIDPIDGTTSFFHGQPFYSVSIAVQENGTTILGAVFAPRLDDLFIAEKNKGAFLNDAPIFVSKTAQLVDSVMATGFACLRAGLEPNNLTHFNRIVPQLRDIRRYGSAALDLCYVACGRLDGFWEMNLNIYDVAAGALIVEEAGGTVWDFNGRNDYPENGIMAANPFLAQKLLNVLS